jgi:hypothetical protein
MPPSQVVSLPPLKGVLPPSGFRGQPLERRRAMLTELLAPIPHGILLSETIDGDGPTVFRHACGMRLEGIVSKRLGSKYRTGRSNRSRQYAPSPPAKFPGGDARRTASHQL